MSILTHSYLDLTQFETENSCLILLALDKLIL